MRSLKIVYGNLLNFSLHLWLFQACCPGVNIDMRKSVGRKMILKFICPPHFGHLMKAQIFRHLIHVLTHFFQEPCYKKVTQDYRDWKVEMCGTLLYCSVRIIIKILVTTGKRYSKNHLSLPFKYTTFLSISTKICHLNYTETYHPHFFRVRVRKIFHSDFQKKFYSVKRGCDFPDSF